MYVYYKKGGKKSGNVIIKNTQQFTNEKKGTPDYSENEIFYGTEGITTLENDFSKLKNGVQFFSNCTNLKTFNANLSSLTNGEFMFYGCEHLTSFSGDLRSLTDGDAMFYGCKHLTSFSGDLSSLTTGTSMFLNCLLDLTSVANIAETIKQVTQKPTITLGVKAELNETTTSVNTYLKNARKDVKTAITKKGWEVVLEENQVTNE